MGGHGTRIPMCYSIGWWPVCLDAYACLCGVRARVGGRARVCVCARVCALGRAWRWDAARESVPRGYARATVPR
eukprot:3270344-Prymnesium_polylepis.1